MDVVADLGKLARAAIEKIGGGAETARKCEVTRYAVQQWKQSRIPAARVGKVSELTGIPAHELRPDLWSPPAKTQPIHASAA